jgi:hypothetical protein
MKNWLIALPFLFAASLAMADEKSQPSVQPKAAMTPTKANHAERQKHKVRHLPRGDLRYCLELKNNKAIIRCAETRQMH